MTVIQFRRSLKILYISQIVAWFLLLVLGIPRVTLARMWVFVVGEAVMDSFVGKSNILCVYWYLGGKLPLSPVCSLYSYELSIFLWVNVHRSLCSHAQALRGNVDPDSWSDICYVLSYV